MSEQWRPVIGWDALYEVSDRGRVRSLPREVVAGGQGGITTRGGRVLKPVPSADGYAYVSLSNGTAKRASVHSLVAEAFLGARPTPEHEVRHLDGDPTHNDLANLAYGTGVENWEDRKRHGRGAYALARGACKHGHPWTTANTYVGPTGSLTCRTCRRDGMRRKYHHEQ